MHIMWDWDEAKRQANRLKHGIDFAELQDFDWPSAVTREDTRSTMASGGSSRPRG